jgi:hypothetical protein
MLSKLITASFQKPLVAIVLALAGTAIGTVGCASCRATSSRISRRRCST